MSDTVASITLFSDPHLSFDSVDEEEKWFPPLCSVLNLPVLRRFHLTERFLSFWDKITQENFVRMVEKIGGQKCDYLIGLGDYTPGANESGMLTSKTHQQYSKFKELLDKNICAEKTLVWGDHDVGYRFDFSKKVGVKIGTEQCGVSLASIEFAEKLVGPPFGEFVIGDAKFIYIATNLIRNVTDEHAEELRVI